MCLEPVVSKHGLASITHLGQSPLLPQTEIEQKYLQIQIEAQVRNYEISILRAYLELLFWRKFFNYILSIFILIAHKKATKFCAYCVVSFKLSFV